MSQFFIHALLCGLVGVVVSLGLSALLRRWYGSAGVLGRLPDFHHGRESSSIPRLGGICIVGGFLASLGLAAILEPAPVLRTVKFWAMLACLLGMFLVGIVDDFRRIRARWKLVLQVVLASCIWLSGSRIEQIQLPALFGLVQLHALGFVVTVFWLVAMTNLINLIDGIDGLAGGIGVLLMGLLSWVAMNSGNGFLSLVCLGVLGALLGFLRFNFPPARIYMGDGGAYFIGFLIGIMSIETSNKGTVVAALAAPVLALAVPILDTSLALVRRASKGLPLFRADQDHIHHRLLAQMGDKRQVLMVLYALCAIATSYAVAVYLHQGRHLAVLTGAGAVVLVWVLQQLRAIPRFGSGWAIMKAHWRLRRHSRRLLGLSRWLEEAMAAGMPLEEVWDRFTRVAPKLGMDRIEVRFGGHEWVWQRSEAAPPADAWRQRHAWEGTCPVAVEFFCCRQRLAEDEFVHVVNLTGEAWHKAAAAIGRTTPRRGDALTSQSEGLQQIQL